MFLELKLADHQYLQAELALGCNSTYKGSNLRITTDGTESIEVTDRDGGIQSTFRLRGHTVGDLLDMRRLGGCQLTDEEVATKVVDHKTAASSRSADLMTQLTTTLRDAEKGLKEVTSTPGGKAKLWLAWTGKNRTKAVLDLLIPNNTATVGSSSEVGSSK